ncbi:MAG: glycosyltransferase family 39 protein [Chloroflexota bacterium]|nr:glycosyltransferase family 39 protein [Chloroflexota bacterium]
MPAHRTLKSLGAVLAVVAILAYAGYLVVYVVYAADLFRWPFDYDQGEGFELYDAILYSQGEWPYRDNAAYPFYASNYPPLFHLLIIPLLPIFGPRLVAGRLVSFIATLITSGVIAIVVRDNTTHPESGQRGGWFIPLISGLAFLASNYVYQIGPLCRMHMTMVMFETLAIAFIAKFEHPRHSRRYLILGLLMLLCAGYTKQMAVFTVAAAIFYVFLRDVKKAITAGVALAAVAGAIFWLLNVATDGQWWINIIQANVNKFDYRQTIFLFGQWFRLHTVFVLLAIGYLVYELFWSRLSVYSLWFFFALGAGALSGKWGAGFGYFTTAIAAACLTSGLALGRLQSREWRMENRERRMENRERRTENGERRMGIVDFRALLAVIIPLLYLVQVPRMLHLPTSGPVFGPLARTLGVADTLIEGDCSTFQYHDTMGYTQLGHLLTADDYAAGEEILNYVRTADGPTLSEEAMLSLLADEPVVTNPTQLLNLYNNDLLDTTEIINRINRQEFGVIIFRAQFYPPPVLEAIGQNYQPVEHLCMNGFYYHILWPQRRLDLSGITDGLESLTHAPLMR